MSLWDLFAILRRRWPMVVVGLLLAVGSLIWIDREPGVYWAQADVIFLSPSSERFPNTLVTGSGSLVAFAGLIERDVNMGSDGASTQSSGVSLADDGVRDGSMVRLPNSGGQWAYNFESPVLDVQAVASSADVVVSRMQSLQDEIQAAVDRRQDDARVDSANRVTLETAPASVQTQYLGGDRKRAKVAATLLSVSLIIGAVVFAETRRPRPRLVQVKPGRHAVESLSHSASAIPQTEALVSRAELVGRSSVP